MEFVPNRIKRRIPTEVEGIGKLRPYLEPGKRRSKYITGQAPSLPASWCPVCGPPLNRWG